METKKKRFSAGMNVGSSSILVTFVLLCLVTFAALSFVSANSDYKLTVETGNRITAYYEADNMAEIYLANIDSLLSKHAATCDEKTYYADIEKVFADNSNYTITRNGDDILIDYSAKISDIQDLHVTLKVLYPSHPTADTFEILEWENISTYVPAEEKTFEEEKGGLLF